MKFTRLTLNFFPKITALFLLVLAFSLPTQAQTHKQYGIKGAKLTARAHSSSPATYKVRGKTYTTKTGKLAKSYSKQGLASYYHHKFNGRRTASGESYNSTLYTAAHKTLPINSYALVTNLNNNRKVIVRINDRGPFGHQRIIDLSHAAAKEIGLIASGTGQVKVEALHVAANGNISGAGTETLAKHARTQEASDRLVLNSGASTIAKTNPANQQYRLKLMNLSSHAEAQQVLNGLSLNGAKSSIEKNGSSYHLTLASIKDRTELNQLKTTIQKKANGKPLLVYTN